MIVASSFSFVILDEITFTAGRMPEQRNRAGKDWMKKMVVMVIQLRLPYDDTRRDNGHCHLYSI